MAFKQQDRGKMKNFIYLGKSNRLCQVLGLFLLISGCAKTTLFIPDPLPEPSSVTKASSVPDAKVEHPKVLSRSEKLPVLQIATWEEKKDSRWQKLQLPSGDFELNVDAIPLNEFIHVALGEVLGLSFIVDPSVAKQQDAITLRISKPVSAQRLLGMVEQTLAAFQVGLAWDRDNLQVMPANKLTELPPAFVAQNSDISERQGRIITIIPLSYASPGEVLNFARHFIQIGKSADVQALRRLNALLVIGNASSVERFKSVVAMIDRPAMAGRKMQLVRTIYWQASEILPLLKDALKLQGMEVAEAAEAPGVFITEVNQLNALMLAAPDTATVDWINSWIEKLDTPEVAGDSLRSFVYRVQHSTAKDIGAVVASVLGDINREGLNDNPVEGKEDVRPQVKSSGNSSLRLVVDEAHNALVFVGSAQSYKTAYQLLQQIDVPAKQVLLEVTVADISLDKVNRLGVEWQYRDLRSNGNLKEIGGTLGGLGLGGSGLVYTAFDSSGFTRARVNALADEGDAKILSSPKLLAVDNEEARIQVGSQIAILTQAVDSNTTGVTSGLLQNFTYVDTGVILSFVPTVMANGVVRLKISQEVSSPGPSNNNTPPIATRRIETTLVAQSGSTVMIGGLISSDNSLKDIKVPGLGDIPLLGNLFKNREIRDNSTEMIVLITPHVIETPLQAEELTKAYREQLDW
ncbi:MAG: hypothetical protein K9K86_00475 [Pseudomonadales bacterium]|nr:hypothetical protein [Pseudomonadales bacterium]